MSHLSDKELDRLSKEAAEQNDVEQNTSGWDSLNLRLEKEMPVNPRKQKRRLLLLLSLLVLLTGSGLVFQYVNGPSPSIDKVSGTRTLSETPDIPGKLPGDEHKTSQNGTRHLNEIPPPVMEKSKVAAADGTTGQKEAVSAGPTTGLPGTTEPENSTAQKTKPSVAGPAKELQSSASTNSDYPRKGKDNPAIDLSSDRISAVQKNASAKKVTPARKEIIPGGVASGEKSIVKDEGNKNTASPQRNTIQEEPAGSMLLMLDAENISIRKPAIDKNTLDALTSPNETSPAIAQKKQQQGTAKKFPFSIAITGGTDWTSVRFTHNDKAGYNAGVMLSWHFSRKFSLSAGALYTKKNYSAYGKDYHPPKGYWTNYITLDELNGSCWMIDIPLNLRYDFAGGKKFNLFGSAGVSTYLMNKESYTYHYMYNGNYARRNWLNENNSSHVLSILNVSAGYEKSVSKKISVQMEPYLKIPVSGIGFGRMQMNSYGLNFSIGYRPEYKKQHTPVPGIHP